jgi:hypothetical protein
LVVRGKGGETREQPNDDLRAQADCFNTQIWLDESARKVGPPLRILQVPRWLAGSLMRGGVEVRGDLGVSAQESACSHRESGNVAVNFGRCDASPELQQPHARV